MKLPYTLEDFFRYYVFCPHCFHGMRPRGVDINNNNPKKACPLCLGHKILDNSTLKPPTQRYAVGFDMNGTLIEEES